MQLNPDHSPEEQIPNLESSIAASVPQDAIQESTRTSRLGWQRRIVRISLALFIFEVGAFLVIFPWTNDWDLNYFQSLTPKIQDLWQEPSFRGALTGLGFVNIYIACLQLVYSFRRR
jgi:hypothetical protein